MPLASAPMKRMLLKDVTIRFIVPPPGRDTRTASFWNAFLEWRQSSSWIRIVNLLQAVPVLRKHQLHVADVTFGKGGGAIGEVVIPHADEAVIETELPHFRQGGVE